MNTEYIQNLKKTISKDLINIKFNINKINEREFLFSDRQILFEQYKLLIDSAHKIEERRSGSNGVFLGVNTLLSSFLINPLQLKTMQLKDIPLLFLLVLIGIFICLDWIKLTGSYKKLNYLNLLLIQAFEELLPTKIFGLRAEIEIESTKLNNQEQDKANMVLEKENILQKFFLGVYIVYLLTIIFHCINITLSNKYF
jgi:hypothetical protein